MSSGDLIYLYDKLVNLQDMLKLRGNISDADTVGKAIDIIQQVIMLRAAITRDYVTSEQVYAYLQGMFGI